MMKYEQTEKATTVHIMGKTFRLDNSRKEACIAVTTTGATMVACNLGNVTEIELDGPRYLDHAERILSGLQFQPGQWIGSAKKGWRRSG